MKITRLLGFAIANLLMLNVGVWSLFAKPLTMPKIVFSGNHNGNRYIYIMDPDGSPELLTTTWGDVKKHKPE